MQHASQDSSLVSTQPPVNPTFHLTAKPEVKGLTADEQSRLQAVAVLNVHELRFDQGSATLTPEARQAIDAAVIPVLRNTVGTYLKIDGTAGWPENAGLDERTINGLSFDRARAVAGLHHQVRHPGRTPGAGHDACPAAATAPTRARPSRTTASTSPSPPCDYGALPTMTTTTTPTSAANALSGSLSSLNLPAILRFLSASRRAASSPSATSAGRARWP